MREVERPIKGILLDMDGVIYRGDHALAGAVEMFPALERAGIGAVMITNNSRLTATGYVEKLANMGIQAHPDQIITSAMATAAYLKEQAPDGAKVYVVGAAGLTKVILSNPGFTIDADEPDFVVVGLDYDLTYARLRTAALAIMRGAKFVATNADANLPMDNGEVWPGAGSIIAAIQTTVGHGPVAILGKPSPFMLEQALEQLGLDRAHCLMVGDRADTDIAAGTRANMPTALVLTGITTEAEIPNLPEEAKPDYVFHNLDELMAFVLKNGA